MVTCLLCGYHNVPGTLFCEDCGGTLAAASPGMEEVGIGARARHGTGERAATEPVGVFSIGNASPSQPSQPSLPVPAPPVSFVRGDIDTGPMNARADDGAPIATLLSQAQAPTTYFTTDAGRRHIVPAQDVAIVGREDMRSGIKPDIDLALDGGGAAGVSRRHCRLLRRPDGWHVEDLMSTNYTVLNGKPLPAHTPIPLHDGDELRLGKLRLAFHSD